MKKTNILCQYCKFKVHLSPCRHQILYNCIKYFNRHQKKVYHYRIRQNPSTEFYIDENINFQSLEEMIEFYKQSQGGWSKTSVLSRHRLLCTLFLYIGLCTKLCEYTAATPESLKDQSSLTGKTQITAIMSLSQLYIAVLIHMQTRNGKFLKLNWALDHKLQRASVEWVLLKARMSPTLGS